MAKTKEKLIGGHTREEHIAMMKDDSKWVMDLILPVKNINGDPMKDDRCLGLLLFDKGPVVYVTNLYILDFEHCEQIVFTSFEELYDAGWVVD